MLYLYEPVVQSPRFRSRFPFGARLLDYPVNCSFSPVPALRYLSIDSLLSSSLWIYPLFSSCNPPGTPCVLPASLYLSLSIWAAVKCPSIREKKCCWNPVPPITSPFSHCVCIQTYFSLLLHVRGTGKKVAYSHILYPIMIQDLCLMDMGNEIYILRRPEGALLKFYYKWKNRKQ